MAMSATLIISILSLLLLHHSPSAAASENNVLVTGEILANEGRLSYNGVEFVMQNDCNLVLYNHRGGFQSNTANRGKMCTLSLSNYGEFIINDGQGRQIWKSRGGSEKGNYAAVLGPDGVVNVFGPSIWSIPNLRFEGSELKNIPFVKNVLFSSQLLTGNAELESEDYKLKLTDDCNLEFRKASVGVVWESNTKGNGQHCFARLNHQGQLNVVADNYVVYWSSTPAARVGNYALIVGINGQAIIYGPVVFTAGTPPGVLAELK